MLGEFLAIISAVSWAFSTILSAEALKYVSPIRSNAIKTFFAVALMVPISLATGELENLFTVNLQSLILVISAAIIGWGIRDTFLFKSITNIGVSRSYTLAYSHPLFAVAFSVAFLGEPFGLNTLGGAILVISSVILVLKNDKKGIMKNSFTGFLLALGAAISWAAGVVLLGLGIREMTALQANALRYPALAFFLFLLSEPTKKWNINKKNLVLLSAAGIIGMVIGGTAFPISMDLIGVSKATLLSASSPVWSSIISNMVLKEKVTPHVFLASVIVVLGIYLLVS